MLSEKARRTSRTPALTVLVLLAMIAPCRARSGPPGQFVVIVNVSNPVTEIDREQLSRLFLKKLTTWDGQLVALPVDQAASSAVRGAFSLDVLQRPVSAVRAYWQQRIFSGRDVPPPVRDAGEDVVRFVRDNPGAVGYVQPETVLGDGVRVLAVREAAR